MSVFVQVYRSHGFWIVTEEGWGKGAGASERLEGADRGGWRPGECVSMPMGRVEVLLDPTYRCNRPIQVTTPTGRLFGRSSGEVASLSDRHRSDSDVTFPHGWWLSLPLSHFHSTVRHYMRK